MRKGFAFKNQTQDCPYCTKTLKSKQALIGHLFFVHGREQLDAWRAGDASTPSSGTPSDGGASFTGKATGRGAMPPVALPSSVDTSNVRGLKTEVELLELEKRKRNLLREFGDGSQRLTPDVGQLLGIGGLQPAVSQTMQERAFGINPQSEVGSLQKLASEAEALDKLRGINRPQGDGGIVNTVKGILAALALAGIGGEQIRGFASRMFQPAPVSTGEFRVGAITLPPGTPMTSQLWSSILEYQKSEAALIYSKEKDRVLADGVTSLAKVLGPLIAEKYGDSGLASSASSGDGGGSVSRQPQEVDQVVLHCDKCGTSTPVPDGITPGQSLKCSNPECDQNFTAVDEQAEARQPKPPRVRRVKVTPPLKETVVCECGQILDVSHREVLSDIECPACGAVGKLTRPDEPILAMEPQPPPKEEGLPSRIFPSHR